MTITTDTFLVYYRETGMYAITGEIIATQGYSLGNWESPAFFTAVEAEEAQVKCRAWTALHGVLPNLCNKEWLAV
jgi:hypothetical protein